MELAIQDNHYRLYRCSSSTFIVIRTHPYDDFEYVIERIAFNSASKAKDAPPTIYEFLYRSIVIDGSYYAYSIIDDPYVY